MNPIVVFFWRKRIPRRLLRPSENGKHRERETPKEQERLTDFRVHFPTSRREARRRPTVPQTSPLDGGGEVVTRSTWQKEKIDGISMSYPLTRTWGLGLEFNKSGNLNPWGNAMNSLRPFMTTRLKPTKPTTNIIRERTCYALSVDVCKAFVTSIIYPSVSNLLIKLATFWCFEIWIITCLSYSL